MFLPLHSVVERTLPSTQTKASNSQSRPGDMRDKHAEARRYVACSEFRAVCLPEQNNRLKKARLAGRPPGPSEKANQSRSEAKERLQIRLARNSLQAFFTSWLLLLASLAYMFSYCHMSLRSNFMLICFFRLVF